MWGYRVVIPESLQITCIVKTKEIARSYVWWPSIDKNIETLCKSCDACLRESANPPHCKTFSWAWPSKPWVRLHADFLGPFFGFNYLIVIDSHSKWVEAAKMKKIDAEHTTAVLKQIFARFGFPLQFVTDNGPTFRAKEFQSYMRNNGIKHTFTAPFHAASNGAAENLVKSFKRSVKKNINDNMSLDDAVTHFLFHYRNTNHSTTGTSPAILMLNRPLRSRLDIIKPNIGNKVVNSQETQIHNRGGVNREFKVGEQIYARDYRSAKPSWAKGTVVDKVGPVSYTVGLDEERDNTSMTWRRHSDQIIRRESQLVHPVRQPEEIDVDNNTENIRDVNVSNEKIEVGMEAKCRYPIRQNIKPPDRLGYPQSSRD